MGPVVSKAQFDKIQRLIQAGIDEGATLVCGGTGRPEGLEHGYYVRPTVFANVRNDMTIAREEIFGPVLATLTFEGEEKAVAIGNSTIYGLAAAVWSKDIKKALRTARALKAGTVWINAYNLYDAASPYGGYKGSGSGRESGMPGLDFYTQTKSVWVDLG